MAYVSFALELTSSRRCDFGLCNTQECPRCLSISATASHDLTLSALGFAPVQVDDIVTDGFQSRKPSSNKLAQTIRHGASRFTTEKPVVDTHTFQSSNGSVDVLQPTRPPSYRSSAGPNFTSSLGDDSKEDCSSNEQGAFTVACGTEQCFTKEDDREGCCTCTAAPSDSVSVRASAGPASTVFEHLKVLLGELNIAAHSSSKKQVGWAFEGAFTNPKPSPEFDTIPYELTMPSLCDMKHRIDQLEAERLLPSPRQRPIVLRTFSSIPAWGFMPRVRASVTLQTTPALPYPAAWTGRNQIFSFSPLAC